MEHAPLRPLPSRPSRPADPRLARTYVGARLPQLDDDAANALALVDLSRVERGQAARELGLGEEQMGSALARGRKALRRSRHALAGSGWCERAERMISDRVDGELGSPARERLDAHLRNCPRCVEHELRLTQAIDALVEGMPAPARPAAAVRLVVPTVRALPPGRAPEEPKLEAPPEEPAVEPPILRPALRPVPPTAPLPEPRQQRPLAPVPQAQPERPAAGVSRPAAPSRRPTPEPPPSPPPAVAPRALADPRPVSALIVAFTWHLAFAVAVLLAVVTIAITAIGIGGGSI